MKRQRGSIASAVAGEIARALGKTPDRLEEYLATKAFFDAHGETIIRGLLPGLQPDGERGFVALCAGRYSERLTRLDIDKDFQRWQAANGDAGDGAMSLIEWIFHPDAPSLLLLARASAKIFLERAPRA